MADEIVVTANLSGGGGGGGGSGSGSSGLIFNVTPLNSGDTPPTVNPTMDALGETELQVKIELSNHDHMADAQTTAEQTITIVAKILPAVSAHSSDVPMIHPDGTSFAIEDFRSEVAQTHIIVTDDTTKTHNRDAYSNHDLNTIYVDYRAFTTTGEHWGAWGESAVMGVMLHEYGHMSPGGVANAANEEYYAMLERAETNNDSGSLYNADNEHFADNFVLEASTDLGLDASQYLNKPQVDPFGFVGASTIFSENMTGSRGYSDDYSSSYSSGSVHAVAALADTGYETFA